MNLNKWNHNIVSHFVSTLFNIKIVGRLMLWHLLKLHLFLRFTKRPHCIFIYILFIHTKQNMWFWFAFPYMIFKCLFPFCRFSFHSFVDSFDVWTFYILMRSSLPIFSSVTYLFIDALLSYPRKHRQFLFENFPLIFFYFNFT